MPGVNGFCDRFLYAWRGFLGEYSPWVKFFILAPEFCNIAEVCGAHPAAPALPSPPLYDVPSVPAGAHSLQRCDRATPCVGLG